MCQGSPGPILLMRGEVTPSPSVPIMLSVPSLSFCFSHELAHQLLLVKEILEGYLPEGAKKVLSSL